LRDTDALRFPDFGKIAESATKDKTKNRRRHTTNPEPIMLNHMASPRPSA